MQEATRYLVIGLGLLLAPPCLERAFCQEPLGRTVDLPFEGYIRVLSADYVLPRTQKDHERERLTKKHPSRVNAVRQVYLAKGQVLGILCDETAIVECNLRWLEDVHDDELRALSLTFNRISDDGLGRLKRFQGLRRLSLTCDDVDIAAVIAECPLLEDLDLFSLGIRQPEADDGKVFCDETVRTISTLRNVRAVRLHGKAFTDAALKELSTRDTIEVVWVTKSQQLTDEGVLALAAAKRLREVVLESSGQFSEDAIRSLLNKQRLELLTLRGPHAFPPPTLERFRAEFPSTVIELIEPMQ